MLNRYGWRAGREVKRSFGALAAVTVFSGGTAWAQMPATSASAAPGSEDLQLTEIIVTAQKREENILQVPVTVNVVSDTQLAQENITSVGDLVRAVPALSGAFFGGGVPQIRGVATVGFARSSESAVSTVLDGVVLGKTPITDLFDLERVEVLSGPQGMLFGKNASSGVINLVTVKPAFNEFDLKGSVDYGRFDYERERLTINVPLGEEAALRFSGYHNGDESVVRDTLTGQNDKTNTLGGRARFRWKPSDHLEINLIGDYARTTDDGLTNLVFSRVPDPAGANAPLAAELASCGIVASPGNTSNCPNSFDPAQATVTRYGVSGQIDYDLPGGYLLTSITANRWVNSGKFGDYRACCDVDSLSAPFFAIGGTPSSDKVFSQELRVTSPAHQLIEFVAGLYGSSTHTYDEVFQAGTLGLLPDIAYTARQQSIDVGQKSYAAFGQATFHVTDQLSLIAGGRLTHETLDVDAVTDSQAQIASILASQNLLLLNIPPLAGFWDAFATVHEHPRTDNFSWKLGIQYEFTPKLMTFATVARGYKGPAVADQGARKDPVTGLAQDAIVRPEIPMSFELGSKATLLEGKLFATLTLFYTRVDDFQTTIFVPNIIPAGFVQGNASYMKTKGLDLSLMGRPFEGLTFNVGAIYNIANYAPDYRVGCGPAQTTAHGCETVDGAQVSAPNPQIPDAPKFKLVSNAEYAHDLSTKVAGFLQSDVQYQTGVFTTSTPDPIQRLPSQFYLNGRIGIRDSSGRWSASLWGRNLLDKQYITYTPDFIAIAPGHAGAYVSGPTAGQFRTFGISADFNF